MLQVTPRTLHTKMNKNPSLNPLLPYDKVHIPCTKLVGPPYTNPFTNFPPN